MLMSRRAFRLFARIFAAGVIAAASLQVAGSRPLPVRGPQALAGQEITFTSPQFVVHALWFKANDETGWSWTGSDEVYAVFSDMNPTHNDRRTSVYGNVDEGDTVNFKTSDQCMAPQSKCDRGLPELNVRYSFWESDYWEYFDFCPGEIPGMHLALQQGACPGDDLIGQGSIIYSQADLVAMLPTVGSSREFTAVMDKNAGKYRFRYRISRIADAERSIVIHLPPIDPSAPTISLQAMQVMVGNRKYVRLTWSGTTTNMVDILRNGALVTTTANDGTHDDAVVAGTYQYRVCNSGSTTACSPQVSVTVT